MPLSRALAHVGLALSLFAGACAWAAPVPPALPLFAGQPLPGARLVFGDFDVQVPLDGDAGRMAADPKQPNAVVELQRTAGGAAGGALRLAWKDTWFATARVDSPPLDLRPYLPRGTIAFDLKVNALARGGLAFRLECGADCERRVSYVLPGRAAAGQGWRPLRYALRCFYRAGDDFSAVTRPFGLEGTGAGEVEIANLRIEAGGVPNADCPDYRTVSTTPEPLNESWSLDWWMARHREKLAEIARRKTAGEPTGIVFLGDSITHNWEKEHPDLWQAMFGSHHPLNLGYGGDRTENLLWRLQHGEIDGIAPKVAVLMIGTNNTGLRHDAADVTVAGIRRDIAEIRRRLPRTRVLLLAIFPRGATPDDALRRANDRVNALLPALADDRHVVFLDINRVFLEPDGRLAPDVMPDLLHPGAEGYRRWQGAMQPTLERLLR